MTKKGKISNLIPDNNNPNAGTVRGMKILSESVSHYGLGKGIATDAKDRILAGNKTTLTAVDLGLEDTIVISDYGDRLIAARRMDLDLSDPNNIAQAFSHLDNRSQEISYELNLGVIVDVIESGIDVTDYIPEELLADLIDTIQPPSDSDSFADEVETNNEVIKKMDLKFSSANYWQVVEKLQAIDPLPEKAILKLCKLSN